MSEEFDPFEVDDSGGIGEYTAIVKSSYFDTDEEYDADTLLLRWDLEITGGDVGFDTRKLSFTCGKKFETPDAGKTAVHESGKPKGFHINSRYGMLCYRAFYDPNSGKEPPTEGMEEDAPEVESFGLREYFAAIGKTPFEADAWEGIEFAIHEEAKDYGGEIGKRKLELPFKIVALPGTKAPTKKAPAKKAAGRKRAAAKKAEPEVNIEAVKEAILDAGEEAEDFAEFMKIGAKILGELVPEGHDELGGLADWLEDEEEGAWSEFDEE